MIRTILAVSVGLAIGFSAGSAAQELDAFAQIPTTWDSDISPNGRWLATGCDADGRRGVCAFDLQSGALTSAFSPPDGFRMNNFYFVGDDYLILNFDYNEEVEFTSGFESVVMTRALSLHMPTGEATVLLRRNSDFFNTTNVVSSLRSDPEKVLMALTRVREDGGGAVQRIREQRSIRSILLEVDLTNGVGRTVSHDSLLGRVLDENGEVLLRIDFDLDRDIYRIRQGFGDHRVIYDGVHTLDRPYISGFLDDTGILFTFPEGPRRGHHRLDINTGEITELGVGVQGDLYGAVVDRLTNRVVAMRALRDGLPSLIFIDEDLKSDADALAEAMGVDRVSILSWTDDRSLLVFEVREAGRPESHFLFDRSAGSVSLVAEAYPGLSNAPLGRIEPFTYQASDGLEIPGYLTWPPGTDSSSGPLPLVVLPHGGPYARDTASFDWWAQAYASMGYLVLQPNFRGSSGYGVEFRDAGFGEFGGRMIEDILDGARYLQAEGIARAGGYCLAGASYGGYAVLMGAIKAPDEVACAIAHSPVTRPLEIVGDNVRAGNSTVVEFWERYMGSRFMSAEGARSISPAFLADQIQAPLLVLHGVDDTVVPIEQSETLEAILGDRPDFELIRLENDDHYLSLVTSRQMLLERSQVMLNTYLPVNE